MMDISFQHAPPCHGTQHVRMLLRAAKFRGSALRRMPRYVDTLTLSNQAWLACGVEMIGGGGNTKEITLILRGFNHLQMEFS